MKAKKKAKKKKQNVKEKVFDKIKAALLDQNPSVMLRYNDQASVLAFAEFVDGLIADTLS